MPVETEINQVVLLKGMSTMKAVCREYLNTQFGGVAAVVEDIYAEYARSAREKAEEAAAALEGERYDDLDRIAHAAKGNALAAGDQETVDAAIALRAAAKARDRGESAAFVARLKELAAAL